MGRSKIIKYCFTGFGSQCHVVQNSIISNEQTKKKYITILVSHFRYKYMFDTIHSIALFRMYIGLSLSNWLTNAKNQVNLLQLLLLVLYCKMWKSVLSGTSVRFNLQKLCKNTEQIRSSIRDRMWLPKLQCS